MLLTQSSAARTNDYVAPYQKLPFPSPVRSEYVPPFFAGELALELIKNVKSAKPSVLQDGSTDPEFYNAFYKSNSHFFTAHDITNEDLALIYSKQMMMLLKSDQIIVQCDNLLVVKKSPASHTLRHNLFFAFWGKIDWKDLFPSVPEYADLLFSHRLLLVEELLYLDQENSIDSVADEFLLESNACCKDELLFVSYLDFTVLTWLAHFGFINYRKGSSYDRVMINLTDAGRNAFRNLVQSAAREALKLN